MIEVNWHPWQENPIDYRKHGGKEHVKLVTPKGERVVITQPGTNFVVTIGDQQTITGGNIPTCYFLNQRGVGIETNKAG